MNVCCYGHEEIAYNTKNCPMCSMNTKNREKEMMAEEEQRGLQRKVAKALYVYSLEDYGFKVVSKDAGEEITERLDDWFVGVVAIAFHKAAKADNT